MYVYAVVNCLTYMLFRFAVHCKAVAISCGAS